MSDRLALRCPAQSRDALRRICRIAPLGLVILLQGVAPSCNGPVGAASTVRAPAAHHEAGSPSAGASATAVEPAQASAPHPARVTAGARLLFRSGFEGNIALGPLSMYGNGAWQNIAGTDSESGFSWPPVVWSGTGRFQLIAGDRERVTSATIGRYMYNEIQTVIGRDGAPTRALYSAVLKSAGGAMQNTDSTQNNFTVFPGASGQTDLYLSYWLKLQPDLLARMTVDHWADRVVTDWKTGVGTGASPGADYRIILSIVGDRAHRRLYWRLQGDNVANGGLPEQIFWRQLNTRTAVPVGRWFRVEVFVRRSKGSDGRVWVAIDGRTLFDRRGPNMGVNNLPWNRIMPFPNYSTSQLLPAYQWVDDFEIWEGLPETASRASPE